MTTISLITRSFETAVQRQRPHGTGVYLNPVEDRVGREFSLRLTDFARATEFYEDLQVEELVGAARAIRWLRSVDPVPIRTGSYGGFWAEVFTQLAEKCKARLQGSALRALTDLESSIAGLRDDNESPLASALIEDLNEIGEGCAIVVPRAAAIEPLSEWLQANGVDATGRIFAPDRVRFAGRFWDTIICLGEPSRYDAGDRNFLTPLVTAPDSETLSFLYPDWSRVFNQSTTEVLSRGLLGDLSSSTPVYRATRTPVRRQAQIDPIGVQYLQEKSSPEIELAARGESRDVDSIDAAPVASGPPVLCFKVKLDLGYVLFVDEKAERIRGVDVDINPPSLQNLRVDRLEPGQWLAVRMDSSEILELRGRALALLAETARAVADSQEDWKLRLARRGDQSGWTSVASGMRDAGVIVSGQERRWATSLAIRPRSDSDFNAMLRYLNYSEAERSNAVYLANRLRSAVSIASRQLSAEVTTTLSKVEIRKADGGLILDVSRADSTSYRVLVAPVLDISDELVEVPTSQLRRAIKEPK